jgi:hypothetical protein
MPFVEIYRKGDRVNIEHFRRNFYVVARLSGEIYWHAGEQRESRGGEIKVWVQRADTAPRILGILPDWQLFIDGARQESKFYDSVEDLGNKVVELRHKEYRFIFHFAS